MTEQEKLLGWCKEDAIVEYLIPLKEAKVDTLIRGCTNYSQIQKFMDRK